MRRAAALSIVFATGLAAVGLAVAGLNGNWSTHLSARAQVEVNDSRGQGQAIFHLSHDGAAIDYKLIASNVENVFMAHIHRGAPGANGPIVVWLHPSTTPVPPATLPKGTGRTDGVLAEGTFTAADLVGPLAGHPLSELVALMNEGGVYVNVHTDDGVAPAGTGPGDLPAGEIRGDLP